MDIYDFGRSFYCFEIDLRVHKPTTVTHQPPWTHNSSRIQVDCITTVTTPDGKRSARYLLGCPHRTERVNVPSGVWTEPNAEFACIASEEKYLILKTYDHAGRKVMFHPPSLGEQPHRQSGLSRDAWSKLQIHLHAAPAERMVNAQAAFKAGFDWRPFVAVTRFKTDDGFSVVMQHPLKCVNLGGVESYSQPDTGPLIVPIEPGKHADPIESLRLAYVAHNFTDWAEFLVKYPAEIPGGAKVDHFGTTVRVKAENELYALR